MTNYVTSFEEFDFGTSSKWKQEQVSVTHTVDPLAVIIYARETQDFNVEFVSFLRNPDLFDYNNLNNSHFEKAKRVRQYYKNRLLMRNLKNQRVSDFMKALLKMLDDEYVITEDLFPVLIKIYDFYIEDTKTDSILSGYKPVKLKLNSTLEIRDTFTPIGFVERKSKHERNEKFYLKNSKNEIALIDIGTNDFSQTLFHFVLDNFNSIGIDGYAVVKNIVGRDFACYQFPANRFNIYKP